LPVRPVEPCAATGRGLGEAGAPSRIVIAERRKHPDPRGRAVFADRGHLAGDEIVVIDVEAVRMGQARAPACQVVLRRVAAGGAGLADLPPERVVGEAEAGPRLRGSRHPSEQVVGVGDVGLGAGPVLQDQPAEPVVAETGRLAGAVAEGSDEA
jgi:hypothetical protein